jgi:predicted RNA-binding Zn ribbon-like protein
VVLPVINSEVEMATKSQAPGQLELVREVVNTLDVEEQKDDLADAAALRAWLDRHRLAPEGGLEEADRRKAIAVREALRALLLANNGDRLDQGAIETLNGAAEEARLAVHFESGGGSVLSPCAGGIQAPLGVILAIVFQAMAEGTWQRLKACHEDTCQWAFYDRSKNGSGTWCSMEVCGNRAKARAYRERHKSAARE